MLRAVTTDGNGSNGSNGNLRRAKDGASQSTICEPEAKGKQGGLDLVLLPACSLSGAAVLTTLCLQALVSLISQRQKTRIPLIVLERLAKRAIFIGGCCCDLVGRAYDLPIRPDQWQTRTG